MTGHVTNPMKQLEIVGIDPKEHPNVDQFARDEAAKQMPPGHVISGLHMKSTPDRKFTAVVFYHEDKPARAGQP